MKHRWTGAWLAAMGGAVWCGSYAWPLLNPFTLDVVLRDDWAQHTLGWLFFRREGFSFPLGSLDGFLHPVGTTLGYMDAIPWVALILRPFSGLLPTDFQYLGLWLVSTAAALAWVGSRIAALSTPHWEQQALAGTWFAMAPTLIERATHPALSGHVFILAALGLHVLPAPTPRAARQHLAAAFCVLVLASATHPYFAIMVLALSLALPWRLRSHLGLGTALAATCAMPALVASELALLGYLGGKVKTADFGFGEFSANLNTFWNSMGHSRLFPGLPTAYLQYEGYCYLGAGCFLLAVAASCQLALPTSRHHVLGFPWRQLGWPLAACVALAVFAFASPIRFGETEVLHIALYQRFEWLTQTFRSSGRFIWPLAYLLNLALLTAVLRGFCARRWAGTCVLLSAVALQSYDLDTAEARSRYAQPAHRRVYAASAWSLAEQDFRHLVLYPAEIQDACEGPRGYRGRAVTDLAYLAYRHSWTFNSGYAARRRPHTVKHCRLLKREVKRGMLRADSIYVVWPRDFRYLQKRGASCGRVDHLHVCVKRPEHPFARYLAAHPD